MVERELGNLMFQLEPGVVCRRECAMSREIVIGQRGTWRCRKLVDLRLSMSRRGVLS